MKTPPFTPLQDLQQYNEELSAVESYLRDMSQGLDKSDAGTPHINLRAAWLINQTGEMAAADHNGRRRMAYTRFSPDIETECLRAHFGTVTLIGQAHRHAGKFPAVVGLGDQSGTNYKVEITNDILEHMDEINRLGNAIMVRTGQHPLSYKEVDELVSIIEEM